MATCRLVPLLAAGAMPACADGRGGEGGLRFTRALSGDLAADTSSSPSASWIDMDGDGDEDLYVLNGYGSLEREPVPQRNVVYRNDAGVLSAVPDHPLVRDVAFSGSATWGDYDNDGGNGVQPVRCGAIVTVTARVGGAVRRQVRHVAARTSWRSATSLTQHFGLGDADHVDRIEVAWPSGRVDTLTGPIPADRTVEVVEGRPRGG